MELSGTARRLRGPAGAFGLAAAAALALALAGVLPEWPGLVHAAALPPLGVFADLRVLLARAPSYPVFFAGLAFSLAARTALLALALGRWDRTGLRLALSFHLVTLPPVFAGSVLLFGGYAAFGNPLFWLGFLVIVVTFLATAAAPWTGAPRLGLAYRAAARRGFDLSTVVTYLVAVTALGGAFHVLVPAGPLVALPLSAALAAGSAVLLGSGTRRLLVARRGVALATAAAMSLGTLAVMAQPSAPPAPPVDPRSHSGSLVLMSGMNSASGIGAILEIHPLVIGFPCQRTRYFSYAGPGDGQPRRLALCEPRTGAPYNEEHTIRPFEELVPLIAPQVEAAPPPVTLITHSQGVWLVWEAMAREGAMGVRHLVLVGTFPDDLVEYPPRGMPGPGLVGADAHRWVIRLAPFGVEEYDPDAHLATDVMAQDDRIRRIMEQDLPPEVQVLNVTSALDLPLMPEGWRVPGAVDACPIPITHGDLPYSPDLHQAVNRFIEGRPQPPCPVWQRLLGPAGAPFAPPRAVD